MNNRQLTISNNFEQVETTLALFAYQATTDASLPLMPKRKFFPTLAVPFRELKGERRLLNFKSFTIYNTSDLPSPVFRLLSFTIKL